MSVTNPSQFQGQFLPHDSLVGELHRLNIAFIVVTSVFIGVRLIVRGFVVRHVAADDYLMVAAGLFATAFSTMAIIGRRPQEQVRSVYYSSDINSQAHGMDLEDMCGTLHKTRDLWKRSRRPSR